MSLADRIVWSVTERGLEANGPVTYVIAKEELAKVRDAKSRIGDWPLQMAAKSWVRMDTFWGPYVDSLRRHQPNQLNSIDLEATWSAASKIIDSRR